MQDVIQVPLSVTGLSDLSPSTRAALTRGVAASIGSAVTPDQVTVISKDASIIGSVSLTVATSSMLETVKDALSVGLASAASASAAQTVSVTAASAKSAGHRRALQVDDGAVAVAPVGNAPRAARVLLQQATGGGSNQSVTFSYNVTGWGSESAGLSAAATASSQLSSALTVAARCTRVATCSGPIASELARVGVQASSVAVVTAPVAQAQLVIQVAAPRAASPSAAAASSSALASALVGSMARDGSGGASALEAALAQSGLTLTIQPTTTIIIVQVPAPAAPVSPASKAGDGEQINTTIIAAAAGAGGAVLLMAVGAIAAWWFIRRAGNNRVQQHQGPPHCAGAVDGTLYDDNAPVHAHFSSPAQQQLRVATPPPPTGQKYQVPAGGILPGNRV